MNRHCTQCKHFVQHYFISENLELCDIYKNGHCKLGLIKDHRLKICKNWSLSDKTHNRVKQRDKLEAVTGRIHTALDELLLIYRLIKKELDMGEIADI